MGQYYEAFPNHAAELEAPLDPALLQRWQSLATELGWPVPQPSTFAPGLTRGDWLRSVWKLRMSSDR